MQSKAFKNRLMIGIKSISSMWKNIRQQTINQHLHTNMYLVVKQTRKARCEEKKQTQTASHLYSLFFWRKQKNLSKRLRTANKQSERNTNK